MKNMRSMTKIALLLLVVAAGSGARAQTRQTVSPGLAYTFTATAASGGGTISYQWFRNGQPILGATDQSYTVPDYLAHGVNVEFKRMAVSAACPNNGMATNSFIVTFCDGLAAAGVCWASVNVDHYQTFATKPDMYTRFYQWNRATEWAPTGTISGWNSASDQSSNVWTINPCPPEWRLPTKDEFQGLHDGSVPVGGTWVAVNAKGNSVTGRMYGPSSATCALSGSMTGCIFLPAVGYRNNSNGALSNQSTYGDYWSSTQVSSTNGYGLSFYSSTSNPAYSGDKAYGFTVRCVQ